MKLVFIAQFCSPHSYLIIDELEFLECTSHERYEFNNFGISCYIYYFLSTFFKFHFITIYLLTFKKRFVRSFTFSIVTFMFTWCRYTYTIYEIVTKQSKWQCRSQACSQPIVRSFIEPSVGRTTYSIYLVRLGHFILSIDQTKGKKLQIHRNLKNRYFFFSCYLRFLDVQQACKFMFRRVCHKDEGSVNTISDYWIIAIYKLLYHSIACPKIVYRKNHGYRNRQVKVKVKEK